MSLAGAIIGGLIVAGGAYAASRETNKKNREIADQATAANMLDAQRNRDFQREMSNTAHQRQVEDLKRAGINPLLAAGMSGASTPSGSTGSAETARMESTLDKLPAAMASAIEMRNSYLAGQKQAADIDLIQDQKNLAKAQAGKAVMETKVMSKGIPEADLKNKVYKWATEKFNSASDAAAKFNSKTHGERMEDLIKESNLFKRKRLP